MGEGGARVACASLCSVCASLLADCCVRRRARESLRGEM